MGRRRTAVRARNESAWLLPNDGTRTNHRLRLDMRRFADADEIDLVIVGCGAGGSVLLQRLARAGWRVAALDAGPFWDPGRRLGQRRGGLAPPVLDRAAGDRGHRPGADGLEQLRPRRRRLDGPLRGLHPALPPERLRHRAPCDGVGADWPLELPRAPPVLRADRAGTAGGRRALAVGRPARLPVPAASGRRERRGLPARRRTSSASPPRSARSRSPTAGSATGRTASTAGSACRAARSTPRRRR